MLALAALSAPPELAPTLPPPAMLHIGGHHAEEAKRYAEAGFGERVVFIEAMPEAHAICAHVAASHGQACLQALLWDQDGAELSFHVTTDAAGNRWSSSVFELTAAHERWAEHVRARPLVQLQLQAHRLDTLVARHPTLLGVKFTHLVLDVQGAELQVLRGMGELLQQLPLQTAVIESSATELYAGQALQAEVARFMRGVGFHCIENCACEFHCDAVFVPERAPEKTREKGASAPQLGRIRCVSEACAARQRAVAVGVK